LAAQRIAISLTRCIVALIVAILVLDEFQCCHMANPAHLELVRLGADAIAGWRRSQAPDSRSGLDLSGATLDGVQLRALDLEFADLSAVVAGAADFSRSNLRQSKMSRADLTDVDLSDASCEDADISGARLRGGKLRRTNLRNADLRGANLTDAFLPNADLTDAKLQGADLTGSYLPLANLTDARLDGANLTRARLSNTKLTRANLTGANLTGAQLIQADLTQATVSGCRVYGIAAWGLTLDGAEQKNLLVTPPREPEVTVDDLEVAQFVYLLLNNKNIRRVIDTVGSKAVLILGRFTPERKAVLDALREEIRHLKYLPVLFDFDPAATQSRMETISTLALLSRFIVADITDAKTVLQELQGVVPGTHTPVQPILISSQTEPGMFDFFHLYPWFLPVVEYADVDTLLASLKQLVIDPADDLAERLIQRLDKVRKPSPPS
jgi:uncharacterized protein YjbI with pentapeptide repeats